MENWSALETRVAAQHPSLHLVYLLSIHTDQIQPHVHQHVLHCKIGRHATRYDLLVGTTLSGDELEGF